jgi:methionine sulfoxide reductase heme-binding subunit
MVLKNEVVFFTCIMLFAIVFSLIAFTVDGSNPWTLAVRLLALNGFIFLSIAAIMTAFLKEITLFLKKPFTRVHHYFAAAGLVLITLHPIVLAIRFSNPAVFLPNVESLYLFLYFGGRQALIVIYIAFAAVLLRRKMVTYWRPLHALMYLALFFGIIHANLSGTDFLNNIFITIGMNTLFAATIIVFIWKRIQFNRTQTISKKRKNTNSRKPKEE